MDYKETCALGKQIVFKLLVKRQKSILMAGVHPHARHGVSTNNVSIM